MKNFSKIITLITVMMFVIAMCGCSKVKNTKAARGNITGKVYDSNGKVLSGARVEIYGGNPWTTTDYMGQYVLANLSPGQYKVVATHDGKSVIIIVNVVQGETTENCNLTFSVSDGLPPLITDVKIASLTENIATITWLTNELSDSVIEYATGAIGLAYTMIASDTSMVTSHTLELTNLKPGQTYHFRVRCRDFDKNEGISSEYQFTTPTGNAPAAPTGFYVGIATESEKLDLMWVSNTEDDLAGYNLYRAEGINGTFTKVNGAPIATAEAAVSYQDEGLKIATKYYYYLKAVDVAGNESEPTETRSVVTPGILEENRTWTFADSPFIIGGDIRVKGGSVLTIEPGVEVKFTTNSLIQDSLGATMTELIIQGGLLASGTSSRPIVFTSAESFPRKSVWGGLIFYGTTQAENIIRNCTFMFADTAIKSDGSSPSIENCEFGYCGVALNIGLSTSLNIKGNKIRDCDIGLMSYNSNIRNNLFYSCSLAASLWGNDDFEYNTVDAITGVEILGPAKPVIKNNIITYSNSYSQGLYGIDQVETTASPTVEYNDIYNLSHPYNGMTGSGTGNIASDPLFIGGTPFDYHLQTVEAGYASDSPCLKAGEAETQIGVYGP
jgi:hypothetical protein